METRQKHRRQFECRYRFANFHAKSIVHALLNQQADLHTTQVWPDALRHWTQICDPSSY